MDEREHRAVKEEIRRLESILSEVKRNNPDDW